MELMMTPRLLFLCTLFAAGATLQAVERPNIVLIMVDDMGYADVGFQGATDIRTPALDQLAAKGVICSSGYAVHPFCGPSRAGMMTGRYPHAFGSQYNLPRNSDTIVGFGIPLAEPFISEVLQDAGYTTGIVGKWHLGAAEGFQPNRRGFDQFYGFRGGGHKYFPAKFHAAYDRQVQAGNPVIVDNLWPMERNGIPERETEYLTDAFSREAVRFVKEAAEVKEPFFLFLAYNAPHSPMEATKEDLAVYQHIKDRKRRVYAAMVHAVDRGVAELVDALKSTGTYDQTLIVFLSDNGGKLKYGSDNGPLRGEKGDCTEGGHRVPMFVHWPEGLPEGQVYAHPVSALDFYPSFAALAGARIPEGKQLDGKDILPALRSGTPARKGEVLLSMRYQGDNTLVGIRQDQWKAVRASHRWTLHDLDHDLGEEHDLSSQHPERLQAMIEKAKIWSRTHVPPRWKHDQVAGEPWKSESPDFNRLFDRD